jgi:hypothetical protein
MTATSWLALYAALVSTLGLVWQIHVFRRNRELEEQRERTDVEVIAESSILLQTVRIPVLIVTVRNRGKYRVTVTTLRIEQEHRPHWSVTPLVFNGKGIPLEVAPRDGEDLILQTSLYDFGSDAIDRTKPLTATAELSTGESFRSLPITLKSNSR